MADPMVLRRDSLVFGWIVGLPPQWLCCASLGIPEGIAPLKGAPLKWYPGKGTQWQTPMVLRVCLCVPPCPHDSDDYVTVT